MIGCMEPRGCRWHLSPVRGWMPLGYNGSEAVEGVEYESDGVDTIFQDAKQKPDKGPTRDVALNAESVNGLSIR